jgi:hypothetical protein
MNDLESLACSSVSQLLFPQDISLQFDNLISLIDSLNRYLIQHRHEKGKSICSKINLYSMTQMLHQNGNIQASINSLQELKQCINVLDELLDQKRPFRLLDAEKLRGLTMLVGFISKVKDDYAVLRTDNISTFLDHFISGLAEQPSKQPLALLLMKMLYSIAPSPAKLANDLGLAKVAEVLIEWGRDLEADFLIPNQEEFDKVKDIRTALSLENGDPLEAFDTFNQRIELTNFFLISESLNQGQQRMLPSTEQHSSIPSLFWPDF